MKSSFKRELLTTIIQHLPPTQKVRIYLMSHPRLTSVHRCLYSCSVVPDNAHYLREDLEGAIHLAASPPLSDIIETIWVVGGTGVYKVGLLDYAGLCLPLIDLS